MEDDCLCECGKVIPPNQRAAYGGCFCEDCWAVHAQYIVDDTADLLLDGAGKARRAAVARLDPDFKNKPYEQRRESNARQ